MACGLLDNRRSHGADDARRSSSGSLMNAASGYGRAVPVSMRVTPSSWRTTTPAVLVQRRSAFAIAPLSLRPVCLFTFLQHLEDASGPLFQDLEVGHHAIGRERLRHAG
jgi:hypothetical protein